MTKVRQVLCVFKYKGGIDAHTGPTQVLLRRVSKKEVRGTHARLILWTSGDSVSLPHVLTVVIPVNPADTKLLVGFSFSLSLVVGLSLGAFTQLIYNW